MPVNVELPEGIWKIIDNNFKLNGESDSEILSKIIKNHLVSLRMDLIQMLIVSFMELTGLKDIVDILDDKIVSIIDLLEKKKLATHQEWNKVMQERIIKNTQSFN